MKVTVRNLGVIREAEVDLKPLTIFVGPNNAGKTWLASTLAGILGPYGWEEYTNAYIESKVPEAYPPLDAFIEQVWNTGNAKIDLVQFADEYGELYLNNVAQLAKQWMQDFMGTDYVTFKDLEISIKLAETRSTFLEKVLQSSIQKRIAGGGGKQKPLLTVLKESGKRDLYVYTFIEGSGAERLPHQAVKESIVEAIFEEFYRALYPYLYTFPTERTTYITIPFINRQFSRDKRITDEILQQKQGLKSLLWPVSHFLSMITLLFQSSKAKREREAKSQPENAVYMQLAQLLEEQILKGRVDFSTPEPDPRREILFIPIDGSPLEIAVASSIVKELAPLVLYLRYLAEPGELLIIDEPEMNLHPEGQAKIIEFLATLVNAGLRIIFMTHSTYVVDHLINLMDATKHENKESIVTMFYLQRGDAFLAQDHVAVYLVDKGKVEGILDENGIIHWATFSDVSDRVMQLHFE